MAICRDLGKNAVNFIPSKNSFFANTPISPLLEIGAYEALWLEEGATFKTIADKFRKDVSALPSDFVSNAKAEAAASQVLDRFSKAGIEEFGVRLHHAGEYPENLRDARHPVEMLYYQGTWELSEKPSIAIVGSRKPSDDGARNAYRIAHSLSQRGVVVVSGLATGIDTAAHTGALDAGQPTIAVIGTPLDASYPKENVDLQKRIAKDHLLISQVPVLRYHKQMFMNNRVFFPERNATMSALTSATVIVEAGETSGTLTQARAAMHQGRKLFILESCFRNKNLTWPIRFEKQGAIRVSSIKDLENRLADALHSD